MARRGDLDTPIADLQLARELAGPITQSNTALLTHVSAATASAIIGSRAEIGALKTQIFRLETLHSTKLKEISGIEADIVARRGQLQEEHERKRRIGLIGALFGAPVVGLASLVMMQQDDARLRQLDAQLTAAKASKETASAKVAAYQALKSRLEVKLETLVTAAAGMEKRPVANEARPAYLVRAAGANINQAEALLKNLRSQIKLLEELRNSAAELGASLAGLLEKMRANLAVAEKLVEDSRRDLVELIKIIVTEDPNAAATAFLKKKAMSMVRALLQEAGLSFGPFINQLLEGVPPGPKRDQLAARLRTQFEKVTGFPFGAGTDR